MFLPRDKRTKSNQIIKQIINTGIDILLSSGIFKPAPNNQPMKLTAVKKANKLFGE